jgi:hypothetical protein
VISSVHTRLICGMIGGHTFVPFSISIAKILPQLLIKFDGIVSVPRVSIYFHHFDAGLTFMPFLRDNFLPEEVFANTAAQEGHRCFFLHIAIFLGLHPFLLAAAFRKLAKARQLLEADDLSDLFVSCIIPCGLVDANVDKNFPILSCSKAYIYNGSNRHSNCCIILPRRDNSEGRLFLEIIWSPFYNAYPCESL